MCTECCLTLCAAWRGPETDKEKQRDECGFIFQFHSTDEHCCLLTELPTEEPHNPSTGCQLLAEKLSRFRAIAKGFCAPLARSRECPCNTCIGETIFPVRAFEKTMNISSVKAISCADRIDWIDTYTLAAPLLRSFSGQSSLGTELHHDKPAEVRKYCQGLRQIICSRDLLCFLLVGEKNIHESQYIENIVRPLPVRIVIRVQRCCEPFCFRVAKYLRRPGSQRAVEKIRREVKMAGRKNVIEVKIRVSQLRHRSRI